MDRYLSLRGVNENMFRLYLKKRDVCEVNLSCACDGKVVHTLLMKVRFVDVINFRVYGLKGGVCLTRLRCSCDLPLFVCAHGCAPGCAVGNAAICSFIFSTWCVVLDKCTPDIKHFGNLKPNWVRERVISLLPKRE